MYPVVHRCMDWNYMKELPLVLTFNVCRVCLAARAANTRPSVYILVCVNNAGFAVHHVVRCCFCLNHGALDAALPNHTTHKLSLVSDRTCPHTDVVVANAQLADYATVGPRGLNDIFLRDQFVLAFGAPLVNHDGRCNCEVHTLWWKVVALRGKQYLLPDGGVWTWFVNMLSEEIERCTEGRQRSEREFIFTALVLQCNKMVRKGKDVCPFLTRRMDMWAAGELFMLRQEAQQCNRQLSASLSLVTWARTVVWDVQSFDAGGQGSFNHEIDDSAWWWRSSRPKGRSPG